MSNMYLRDFINENVGPECGGGDSGSGTTSNSIQSQLNELKSRLDALSNGIGFTAKIQHYIFLPCAVVENYLIAAVPEDGTIVSLTILADQLGYLEAATITQSGSATASRSVTLNSTKRSNKVLIGLPVKSEDILTVTTTSSLGGLPIHGGFVLRLPEETINIS